MTEERIIVRPAQLTDAGIIAGHRMGMFRDIGRIPAHLLPDMRAESQLWVERVMADGTYLGWLASPAYAPHQVVAGAGVLLRDAPPSLTDTMPPAVRTGVQALVVNVYTEP